MHAQRDHVGEHERFTQTAPVLVTVGSSLVQPFDVCAAEATAIAVMTPGSARRSPARLRARPRERRTVRRTRSTSSPGPDEPPVALAAALELHAKGFSLVPLEAGGKRPHAGVLDAVHGSASWGDLRDRRASAVEVAAWFDVDPAAGLGLIVTPGLVVVDVDDPARFDLTLPATPTVRTARGAHYYLAGDVKGVTKTAWGEVRGAGSYVVAAPSVHESGHVYRWTTTLDVPFAELPEVLSGEPSARPSKARPLRTNVGPRKRGDLTHDARAVSAVMRLLNRPDAIDAAGRTREVSCVLADHEDRRPSAGLFRHDSGAWRYRCHGCGRHLSLARLGAAVMSGTADGSDAMPGPVAARWLARLWHEAGVRPVPMPTVAPPRGCSPAARTLAAGFGLLSGLRAVEENDAGLIPFTARFAAAWCALDVDEAKAGLRELRELGWLIADGPSRWGVGYLYRRPAPAGSVEVGGQEVKRDDRQAAPLDVGVAEEVHLPNRPLPLETARLPALVAEPFDEGREVVVVKAAEVVTDDGGAPATSGGAGGRGGRGGRVHGLHRKPRVVPSLWRFGRQSPAAEAREIKAAQAGGRAEEYVRGQRAAPDAPDAAAAGVLAVTRRSLRQPNTNTSRVSRAPARRPRRPLKAV